MPIPSVGVLPGAWRGSNSFKTHARAAGWDVESLDGVSTGETLSLVVGTPTELANIVDGLNLTTGRLAIGDGDMTVIVDGRIDATIDEASAGALLARWSPLPLPEATQRQRDAFGRAAIDPLLASLRDRLVSALSVRPEEARAVAHQLAGLAGILGFTDLSHAWEAYSTGGDSQRPDARRLARIALATLRQTDLSDSTA